MHIRVVPSGKYHLVYLVENWREGGTTRSRNVVKFGRLEDLVKDDPDALDKLKAKYNEDREKAAVANEQLIAKLNDEALSSSTNGAAPSVGYGLEPLRQIWEKDLDLSYWLNYLKRYKTKLDFDVDAVSSYMVGQKVLDPSSILTAYDARTSLFERHGYSTTVATRINKYTDMYLKVDTINMSGCMRLISHLYHEHITSYRHDKFIRCMHRGLYK